MINKQRLQELIFNPRVNHEELCQMVLHDLLLSQVETNDFANYLVKNWKRIYNYSEYRVLKNETNAKTIQLIDNKYRDITVDINTARSGNINIYITSINGYCCRRRNKDVSVHVDMGFV